MARRKLTPEQENWLYLHYPEMTNKELSTFLSEWTEKDNQKQYERLKKLLEEDFSDGARKIIIKKMNAIERYNGVSVTLIKRYAKILHCRPKSREHIILCNQEKAKNTNLKRWLKKAEKVEHIMEWLRSFDEKDVRFCSIEDRNQLKSFQVSINKFNRYEGYGKQVYLSSQFIPEAKLLRVHASLYRATR